MSHVPKWFVANCSSMLSFESPKGAAIIPALLLPPKKRKEMLQLESYIPSHVNPQLTGESKKQCVKRQ